jgi:hypothetical protein
MGHLDFWTDTLTGLALLSLALIVFIEIILVRRRLAADAGVWPSVSEMLTMLVSYNFVLMIAFSDHFVDGFKEWTGCSEWQAILFTFVEIAFPALAVSIWRQSQPDGDSRLDFVEEIVTFR